MPFWRTFYHVVWATQDRRALISSVLEPELFAVMSTTAKTKGVTVHALNGTVDHVHAVLSVPPTIAVATLIGQIQGASAHLANQRMVGGSQFKWERGYGLFTVGPRQVQRAVEYVRNQKDHHSQGTLSAALERTDDAA